MKRIIAFLFFLSLLFSEKNNLFAYSDTTSLKPLINFETTLLTGEKFKLNDYIGKVIVLNFWFISCPPCMGEIPDINKIYRTYKDSNVIVLSLATNSTEQLIKFNERKKFGPIEKIEYPIIPDCQKISNEYGITGYPTTIIIDKKGFIRITTGATLQSLKNYVAFYGDKNLSADWKKLLEESSDKKEIKTSEVLKTYIDALLNE